MNKKMFKNLKVNVLYFLGNILYELIYCKPSYIQTEENEQEFCSEGYTLKKRWYSWLILSVIFIPFKFIYYGISYGLESIFSYFSNIFKWRYYIKIGGSKNISNQDKKKIFTYLLYYSK